MPVGLARDCAPVITGDDILYKFALYEQDNRRKLVGIEAAVAGGSRDIRCDKSRLYMTTKHR